MTSEPRTYDGQALAPEKRVRRTGRPASRFGPSTTSTAVFQDRRQLRECGGGLPSTPCGIDRKVFRRGARETSRPCSTTSALSSRRKAITPTRRGGTESVRHFRSRRKLLGPGHPDLALSLGVWRCGLAAEESSSRGRRRRRARSRRAANAFGPESSMVGVGGLQSGLRSTRRRGLYAGEQYCALAIYRAGLPYAQAAALLPTSSRRFAGDYYALAESLYDQASRSTRKRAASAISTWPGYSSANIGVLREHGRLRAPNDGRIASDSVRAGPASATWPFRWATSVSL